MTFQDFCDKYNQNLKNNVDAQKLFDFLATPSTIHNMMVFSQVGLPAISGIIPHLEQNFGNSPTFPLSDFRNRQTTGKMVKYILGFYGYKRPPVLFRIQNQLPNQICLAYIFQKVCPVQHKEWLHNDYNEPPRPPTPESPQFLY